MSNTGTLYLSIDALIVDKSDTSLLKILYNMTLVFCLFPNNQEINCAYFIQMPDKALLYSNVLPCVMLNFYLNITLCAQLNVLCYTGAFITITE